LKREGSNHSLWISALTGSVEAIPRHNEIPDLLAKKIIKNLNAVK
jgi:mRNA interferase HicA